MNTGPVRIRAVLVLTLLVAACFGDPPPAAADLPLEIVVHPDECLLNYTQVGPGTHEVTVIFEGTSGSVRILDGDESVYSNDGSSPSGSVELEMGDYVVECESVEDTMDLALAVRAGLPPGGG